MPNMLIGQHTKEEVETISTTEKHSWLSEIKRVGPKTAGRALLFKEIIGSTRDTTHAEIRG
jgi:hypothetical protein